MEFNSIFTNKYIFVPKDHPDSSSLIGYADVINDICLVFSGVVEEFKSSAVFRINDNTIENTSNIVKINENDLYDYSGNPKYKPFPEFFHDNISIGDTLPLDTSMFRLGFISTNGNNIIPICKISHFHNKIFLDISDEMEKRFLGLYINFIYLGPSDKVRLSRQKLEIPLSSNTKIIYDKGLALIKSNFLTN